MTLLPNTLDETADGLSRRLGHLSAEALLARLILIEFPGRIALVSSFGIEAAVLLHMVAQIEPAAPVLFVDTGQLFRETLEHRDALVARLGLADVRSVAPLEADIARRDPDGALWASDPDACCRLRKVEPLDRALAGIDVWINGRRRGHGGARLSLPRFEAADGRIKVNALADWEDDQLDAYAAAYRLPAHPLQAHGYRSVGCMPCSDRSRPGEDPRAGRWRGRGKTECGIHLPRG